MTSATTDNSRAYKLHMRYGERKTVLRDARLRTTATEDAMLDRLADMMRRHGITGPYWYILGRDNYTVCGYHI